MAEKEDQRELLKRAVAAVQDLRSRLNAEQQKSREPVAVIGVGCRLPAGADSPGAFWQLLDKAIDAVSEIPRSRFPIDDYYDPNPDSPGKVSTRRGAFLDAIDKFDAEFFGISPREAIQMDPQQRILLEVAWEGLEDAGLTLERLARSLTGVFVGAITADYMWRQLDDPACIDAYSGTGTHSSILSGRLSYLLDLRGPSMTLDTACSSSLVAVHLACQSLRQRECNMAVAAGVNLVTSPVSLMSYSRMGLLSPDGLCKTFDSRADGFVGGEGCGVIVLKRLSDAIADGDPIRAVIRGSAVNQDGKSSTLTAPNGPSQVDVLVRSLANAGITADRVTYMEAHGTGTALGDPIEVEALKSVLDVDSAAPPCAIGSVKTNIGHLGAAAGIAGLIKVVLSLQHRTIPRHLHFVSLNPHISLEGSRLFVPIEQIPWNDARGPLTAGVSSFGWSGTNAHVVLEEAPERTSANATIPAGDTYLLPLSARSPAALAASAEAYSRTLSGLPSSAALDDLCFTAGVRRTHHKHRLAVTGKSAKDLANYLMGEVREFRVQPRREDVLAGGIAFVFCGQGAQWAGMGRELYDREEVFRSALDEIDAVIRQKAGWSVRDAVDLDDTKYAQPVIFALQVALTRLWQSWGIEPAAVVGHSVGEIAAAHISGVLTLEDAVTVALHRANRMQAATGKGAMAEVALSPKDASQVISEFEGVSISAFNGPNSVVFGGEPVALDSAIQTLEARGIRGTRLRVNYAFHSPQMEPYVEPLVRDLHGLKVQPVQIPFFSTVHGGPGASGDFSAQYWGKNIRQPVLFEGAIARMIEQGHRMFLEVGPHPVLTAAILNSLESRNVHGAAIASLHRKRPERGSMLDSLATLYSAGANIKFRNVSARGKYFASLPTYPWQRKRYWLDVQSSRVVPSGDHSPAAIYEIGWERFEPASGADVDAAIRSRNWIILEDNLSTGNALSMSLRQRVEDAGVFCAQVAVGGDRAQCEDVFRTALGDKTGAWNVVFVCPGSTKPESAVALAESVLMAAQCACDARQEIKLWFVTRGAQAPNAASSAAGVWHSPILGLARVLAVEQQHLWGGIVDVASGMEHGGSSVLACMAADRPENEFVVNSTGVFVPRLSESVPDADPARLKVHSDKGYLVTGGLGGVGLTIARALVDKGARHLMLMSRGEPSKEALAAVREMQSQGAACSIRRGDVSNLRDVREAVAAFGTDLPELAGIVHAAGVVQDAAFPFVTKEQLRSVLAPKVNGAWNLHEAAGDRPLDFFVMFSSVSSVLGTPGQASYSAANCFLDRLAHHRQSLALPGLTINWGPWADTGMTGQLSGSARLRLAEQGVTPLSRAQGAEAFLRLAGTQESQCAVALIDWDRFRQSRTELPIARALAGSRSSEPPPAAVESAIDQFLSVSEVGRGAWLADWILRKTARILKTDTVDISPERNLLELGFDSLMVMEFLRAVGQEFRMRIYPREFYAHPSVDAFSGYLLAELLRKPEAAQAPIALRSTHSGKAPLQAREPRKLAAPVAFLLSAPRSGSTLLRVMLAGHPQVFCPPELHLLGFNTMGERKSALHGSHLDEGLVRAIKELKGIPAEEAQSIAEDWVAKDLPVDVAYERLQELAQGRLLIDKSPSYAGSMETLRSAERHFAAPKYIHLVRHPASVIDSFVKNRFDRLLGLAGESPRDAAEKVWRESNGNLSEFLQCVAPSRSLVVRYEDLVQTPAAVMKDICSFLEVPFDDAVLRPYDGARMTDGLRTQSIGIGDPGFLEHKEIDASLADVWRRAEGASLLGQEVRRMAVKFKYDIPSTAVAEAEMTEEFHEVRGLSLCLCSWGPLDGGPIFILHGVLDHGAAWGDVASSLASRGFRILAPDHRGHGRSQHAGAEGSYHLMDFLADADVLVRKLNIAPLTLVGHSMGAGLAAMLTAARPELVRRLILVESILASSGIHRKASDVLSSHLNALEMGTKSHTFADASAAATRLRLAYPSMDASQAAKVASRLLERCPDGVRWRWDERIRSRAGLAFHGTFDLDANRFLSILSEIRVPVTLVRGSDSEFVSREQAASQLQALQEGHEITLKGGHNLHLECAASLADIIAREAEAVSTARRS